MATGDTWCIEKLQGDNYATWKFQLKHMLLAKGLWGVVDESEAVPVDGTALANHVQKQQKAFAHIVMSINASLLYVITSAELPSEAWKLLKGHFEKDTAANRIHLKKSLFRCEMKSGTPLQEHIKKMKELTDRLAGIGSVVTEEDQVVTLLGSLPSEYRTIVTALETQVQNHDVSLAFVQQALLHEETKQKDVFAESGYASGGVEGALVGQCAQQRWGGGWRPGLKCHICEGPHFKRDCPQGYKIEQQGHRNAKVATTHDHDWESDAGFAAFVGSAKESKSTEWLIDSGASCHIANDRSIVANYEKFPKKQKVCLGDGHIVYADGMGTVKLPVSIAGQRKELQLKRVLVVPEMAYNLFSVLVVDEKGGEVSFKGRSAIVKDKGGAVRVTGKAVRNVYYLELWQDVKPKQGCREFDMKKVHAGIAYVNEKCKECSVAQTKVDYLRAEKQKAESTTASMLDQLSVLQEYVNRINVEHRSAVVQLWGKAVAQNARGVAVLSDHVNTLLISDAFVKKQCMELTAERNVLREEIYHMHDVIAKMHSSITYLQEQVKQSDVDRDKLKQQVHVLLDESSPKDVTLSVMIGESRVESGSLSVDDIPVPVQQRHHERKCPRKEAVEGIYPLKRSCDTQDAQHGAKITKALGGQCDWKQIAENGGNAQFQSRIRAKVGLPKERQPIARDVKPSWCFQKCATLKTWGDEGT